MLAHLDGYFESANDNAGGIASVLALARHFARAGAPRRGRNLLFVGTSGHHEESDGVAAFIAAHGELRDKTVFVINANAEHRPPTGEAFGFFRAGYPVAQIIDSNLWYHSSGDTLDTIVPQGLERATRAYAWVLDRLDRAGRAELGKR